MSFPLLDKELNFTLSGATARTARNFAKEHLTPFAAMWDYEKRFPKEALAHLAKLGFFTLRLPQEDGGQALSNVEYCEVIRELSYGCPSTSITLAVSNMVATILNQHAQPALLTKLRERFRAKHDALLAFAITEPAAGSDAQGIESLYSKKDDGFLLNGHKCFITSAKHAAGFLVTARNAKQPEQLTTFFVNADASGVRFGKEEVKLGLRASSTVQLFFDNVQVSVEQQVGNAGEGFKIAMSALVGGRLGVAAQALGMALKAFHLAHDYVSKSSKSQSFRWSVIDMAMRLEAAMLLIYDAARLADDGKPDPQAASRAKLYASEVANQIVQQALSLVGRSQATTSQPLERLLRDCRVTSIYEGTSEIQRLVIARGLLKKDLEALL